MAALELGDQHIHPTPMRRPAPVPHAFTHHCVHRVLTQERRLVGVTKCTAEVGGVMRGVATGDGTMGGEPTGPCGSTSGGVLQAAAGLEAARLAAARPATKDPQSD